MNPKLTYWARSRIHRLHLLPLPRRHHHDDDCVLPALWALQIPLSKNTQKALKHTQTECARLCVSISVSFQEEFKFATTTAKSVRNRSIVPGKIPIRRMLQNKQELKKDRAPSSAKRNLLPHLNTGKIGGNQRLEPSGLWHIALPARAVIPVRRVPSMNVRNPFNWFNWNTTLN